MPSCINIARFVLSFLAANLLWQPLANSQKNARSRNIQFYHLTTAQGLSDNYVRDMCTDKTGNLWIGTQDGLNMFNGKTVSWFLKETNGQLTTDHIRKLYCDEKDRIWVLGQGGYTVMIDENRRFHKVSLYHKEKFTHARWLLASKVHGAILFTSEGFYSLSAREKVIDKDSLTNDFFTRLDIPGMDTLFQKSFLQVEEFDDNRHILSYEDGFFVIDFGKKKISEKYLFANSYVLDKWRPDELLIYDRKDPELQSINLLTKQVSWPLRGIKDQHGKPLSARIINAKMIDEESLLLSTYLDGLYMFNIKTNILTSYRHNAADPTTFINDLPKTIKVGNDGWVFIAASPNGLSYFKKNAVVGSQSVFMDKLGNSYNGYVSCIASLDNNTFYIGVANNLLKWDRSTNTTHFLDYGEFDGKKMIHSENVTHMEIDQLNRIWVLTLEHGVFILDKADKTKMHLRYDPLRPNSLPAKRLYDIKKGPGDYLWHSSDSGICRVNIRNFQIDHLKNTALIQLKNISCNVIFFEDDENLWIGTQNKGLWHYSFSGDSLVNYNEKDGFIGNYILAINKDSNGNIYAGTSKGLEIVFKNGGTKKITQKDGLMHPRAEILLLDKKNRMWIGNDVGIGCFSIADSSFRYFDETYGLSIQGFRVTSYWQTTDDELVWGTENGIQYFYPDELYNYKNNLKVTVNRIETRDIFTNLTSSKEFRLAANDNYVTFYFGTIEYLTQLRTFYEYKLEGLDKDWIRVVNQNSVRYSSLPPGKYTFRIRASNDSKTWVDAENPVTLTIGVPFYNTWWFKAIAIFITVILFWYVLRYYRKKQLKQQEELESQIVINYFASQINIQQHTDDLLWDVAKNCISKLNFEDCVIYLLDSERNVLVQKAAWGPKMERDFTIYQPIEIPIGSGIVGTVARTGKPELITNTELDDRYIADDARRYSELAVPIIMDNKVIGVIDSEHTKKNFFTQRHLTILSTIAVLCANQIQRSRAEEEKQKATIEVLENKQKVTESRLQSLRLQMNPHFLFNALNSIQQMILANEEMVATRYLSRFSKLLRTILVHSDKEMVSLREELEILNLYVELEAIRFKDSFKYSIDCDEDIDKDEVKVPTLLIQPFVENAIWHGLMHKEGIRNLAIRFFEKDDHLHCIVEDNGIGREKARESKIAAGQTKTHASRGIAVSLERLKTLRGSNGHAGSLTIIDLKNDAGIASGTRVEIDFPIQN
jgi:ligand-binding sensor domain-containing protein/putative methionine-R-sulfoxide reductase with GAF domain